MDERLWENDKDGSCTQKVVLNVERTDVVTHLLPIPVINTFKVQHLPASRSEGTIECGDDKGSLVFDCSKDQSIEKLRGPSLRVEYRVSQKLHACSLLEVNSRLFSLPFSQGTKHVAPLSFGTSRC